MRNRCLLHVNQLEKFKEWVVTKGWTIEPTPPQAEYEVLRFFRRKSAGKVERHIFFKRSANLSGIPDKHHPSSTHLTIPGDAEKIVRQFIIEKF